MITGLFSCTTSWEKKDEIKIMVVEVDMASFTVGTPKELMTIEQKNVGLFQGMDLMTSFRFAIAVSPDHSKRAIFWCSGLNNKLFISVFGENLTKTRSIIETIKGTEKFYLSNTCIDNTGNVFAAYGYTGSPRSFSHLLIYKNEGQTVDMEIKPDQGEIYGPFIALSETGDVLHICGLLKETTENLSGAFSQTLNTSTFQMGPRKKTAFPAALVEQFDNDGWGNTKAKKYGIAPQVNLQPIVLGDGTLDLVGEFRRSETTTRAQYDISGDLLNVHFTNAGAVFSRIPKARVSAGSTVGDSFHPFAFKDQLILFYNDHDANLKQDITKSASRSDNYKNSVLVAATMAADGTVKRQVVADLNKENHLAIIESMRKLSPSSLSVPFRKVKGLGGVADDFRIGTIDIQ